MSAFKNLLKSETPTADSDASRSSALGGQGSHFHQDDPPLATRAADAGFGSTVTGSEPHTAGPSDTSNVPAPASHARTTAGPEAGGSSHIGTAPASDSAALSGDKSATSSFPQTLRSGDTSADPSTSAKAGSAAVGETTTYSSRPLASGDPTGGVINHQSTDPLTYKLPEAGSHASGTANTSTTGTTPTNSSAITSSGAAAAASRAWSTHNKEDNMPGGFPSAGHENPYKANNLDPRVDGGKLGPSAVQPGSSLPTRTRDTPLESSSHGPSTSTGLGSLGTSHGDRSVSSTHDRTGPAPSTLTTTADPSARSAEYGTSSSTKVPDSSTLGTTQSHSNDDQRGVVGRTLGALGLGGAANSAANYLGYGTQGTDSTSGPRDTSAIATQPGVTAQESGPPKHYRRESIPTTAYPGGPTSPRAVAPPVGGAIDPRRSVDQGYSGSNTDSRISNERGIGGTPATTEGVTSSSGYGLGSATSGVPRQDYSDSSRLRDNIGTQQSGYSSSRPSGTEDSHTGRNLATVGAAAAAVGAGAGSHGLQHQERSDNLRSSAAEDARRLPTGAGDSTLSSGQSYTIGGHQSAPVDAISSRNPNDRESDSRGLGHGSSSSPNAPIDAVAAASGRFEGQDYSQHGSRRDEDRHHHHTGDVAAAAALGAGPGLAFASGDGQRHSTIHDAITVTPSAADRSTYEGSTGYGITDSSSYGTSTGHATTGTTGTTGVPSHGISSRHDTTGTTDSSSYGTSGGQGITGRTVHDNTTGDRTYRQEDDHTGRNVGLGAVAGGAAYAAHDRKEEKHHEKELRHEEKERAREAEKREHARLAAEQEDRKRRERESAAGIATAGHSGPVAREHDSAHQEKKPSIFKRIFKSRKNKDTGEDEDYSTDDEDDKARHTAAGGSSVPVHHSDNKGRTVLGHGHGQESTSAGYTPTGHEGGATVVSGAAAGQSYGYGTDGRPVEHSTGLPYDPSTDPGAAGRLAEAARLASQPMGELGEHSR